MKEQIEKLKTLCKEMAHWGTELGLSQNHNTISKTLKIYFAKNYSIWTVYLGPQDYSYNQQSFEYTNYTFNVIFGETMIDADLEKLYIECRAEFDRVKTERESELREKAEKEKAERVAELKKELEALQNN